MNTRSAFASNNDISTNDIISDTDTTMANPTKPFSVRPSVSMNELQMDEFKLEPGAASPEGAQSPRNEADVDASKKPSQRLLIRKYDSWSALDEGSSGSVVQSPQSPRALLVMKRMAADEKPPRPTPAPALRPNSQLPPLAPAPDSTTAQQ
ncbi:Hypothetical protein, putative [Bodo saltans]|uniref:Uncharacterized protein n=1 Tax=Bodo saltans TaxID=75058 RepID=A0A0S4IUW6_BODSA|nr:Hypothetical protein, putative [Bodo saltans]|eukprot:CUG00015.1 Hypothetical protein, putative [Bodo saltans]